MTTVKELRKDVDQLKHNAHIISDSWGKTFNQVINNLIEFSRIDDNTPIATRQKIEDKLQQSIKKSQEKSTVFRVVQP